MITKEWLVKLILIKKELDSKAHSLESSMRTLWFEWDMHSTYLVERTISLLNPELYDWLLWYWYDRPKGSNKVTYNNKEYDVRTPKSFANFLIKECIVL